MKRRLDIVEKLIFPCVLLGILVIEALSVLIQFSFTRDADPEIVWSLIRRIWTNTIPVLAMGAVHNYLIAPLLVNQGRVKIYLALTIPAFLLSTVVIFAMDPSVSKFFVGEVALSHPPRPLPPLTPVGAYTSAIPLHPVSLTVISFLLVFLNLGILVFFRSLRERERTEALEKENLRYRMEYLRYQINPHFMMNTMNNIHALVDIDPERAKECVVMLASLFRYLSYESSGRTLVPVEGELGFTRDLLALMSIRYDSNVEITADLPPAGSVSGQLPPLVIATIIENAFKHGVSSSRHSFVRISARADSGRFIFRCVNSLVPVASGSGTGLGVGSVVGSVAGSGLGSGSVVGLGARSGSGSGYGSGSAGIIDLDKADGLGLDNIRKRLELIYGKDFTFSAGVTAAIPASDTPGSGSGAAFAPGSGACNSASACTAPASASSANGDCFEAILEVPLAGPR